MANEGMRKVGRRVLPVLLLGGMAALAACTESTPEFRRNVEIRTDGPPAQCVVTQGRTSVALESTPGSVLLPYVVERPLVECRNRNGWRGSVMADLPNWRREQVVVVPMHR